MSELQRKLGLAFKAERERKDLDLSDLSDELKISLVHLEAIESGHAGDLPSELYYKLFTKSYAERLGIDLTATIEAIKDDIGLSFDNDSLAESQSDDDKPLHEDTEEEHEHYPHTEADPDTNIINSALPAAMGATVMAGLVLGIYALFSSAGSSNQNTDAKDALRAEVIEYRREVAEYDWSIPPTTSPKPLVLSMSSVEDSWATVVADGDTVVYRTIPPGRVFTVEAKYRFLVSIGIPSVVTVSLNGRTINLRDPVSRRISKVEINQVNADRFPAAAAARPRPVLPTITPADSLARAGDRF